MAANPSPITVNLDEPTRAWIDAVASTKKITPEAVMEAFVEVGIRLCVNGLSGPDLDLPSDLLMRVAEYRELSRRASAVIGAAEKVLADHGGVLASLTEAEKGRG